jgi:hypothetical protein
LRKIGLNPEWLEQEIEMFQSNCIQSSKQCAGMSREVFNERSKLRRPKSLISLNTVGELTYAI